ncbi:MAG: N-acetylmuramoyl-L-alanine amidase [Bacteroidales bacterium]|nr:N-acetylmuramoyl-L-alanine amidase [Bacteroidales bacterium]
MKKILKIITIVLIMALAVFVSYYFIFIPRHYKEIKYHTATIRKGTNQVQGIVLHHTATAFLDASLHGLTAEGSGRSCHVLINYDGTRYILAEPKEITGHAGKSYFNGKSDCNKFTIGIEFQGSTNIFPLTNRQIASAVEYIKPIMREYNIPIENIVTHKTIRDNYNKMYPSKHASPKIDICQRDYKRVIKALKE